MYSVQMFSFGSKLLCVKILSFFSTVSKSESNFEAKTGKKRLKNRNTYFINKCVSESNMPCGGAILSKNVKIVVPYYSGFRGERTSAQHDFLQAIC
jgi:hypothetical protein